MSRLAIKTEKLDDGQDEIGIESRTAEAEEGGFGRQQEHRKGASTMTNMNNLMRAGKQQFEVGRNTNMAKRQLQQNSPQPTTLLKGNTRGNGGSGTNTNTSGQINSNQHEINSTNKATLPKSRCGEVFVSNNARQWTFICTYCNKSTRDIGEFICHIKIKHLGGFTDELDETDDGDYDGNQTTNLYEQDQDYMDCGNYLDVNVHTEADDYNLNGHEQPATYRNHLPQRQAAVVPKLAVANKRQVDKRQQSRLNSVDLDATNDDESEPAYGGGAGGGGFGTTSNQKESAAQWRADPANFQSYSSNKYNYNASTPEIKLKTTKTENGNSTADFDASDYAFGKEDFDTTAEVSGAYEIDDDDDYDNQLLIAPNDSMDASVLGSALADYSGGGIGSDGMKTTKRRQIRGTAYCALCNKTFQYYSLYRNHMIKHSNETPFKCPICKKGFKSKQAIRYHMNTHQREKQFKCTICSAAYGTENHFIAHIMSHENETTFPCLVCGQVMSSDKARDIHMAEHKEERPFRCDYCNKLFRLRHHLSNHLKMHRKYRCDYCKEIFTSAIYLRKPYACPGCESTPDAQQDGANTSIVKRKEGNSSSGKIKNPLEIYETTMTGQEQQQQGDDYAQMVTDSEGEGENDENDEVDDEEDDDDDDEVENVDDNGDSNSNEQAGDEVDENDESSSGVMKGKRNNDEDDNDDAEEEEDEEEEVAAGGSGQLLVTMKRYKCKYCPSNYTHPSGLSYHMKHKHLK